LNAFKGTSRPGKTSGKTNLGFHYLAKMTFDAITGKPIIIFQTSGCVAFTRALDAAIRDQSHRKHTGQPPHSVHRAVMYPDLAANMKTENVLVDVKKMYHKTAQELLDMEMIRLPKVRPMNIKLKQLLKTSIPSADNESNSMHFHYWNKKSDYKQWTYYVCNWCAAQNKQLGKKTYAHMVRRPTGGERPQRTSCKIIPHPVSCSCGDVVVNHKTFPGCSSGTKKKKKKKENPKKNLFGFFNKQKSK
jgi:hypothetical protein